MSNCCARAAETTASKGKGGKQQQAPRDRDAKRGGKGVGEQPPDKKASPERGGKKDKASPERAPAAPAPAAAANDAKPEERSKKQPLGRVNEGPVAFAQGSLLLLWPPG